MEKLKKLEKLTGTPKFKDSAFERLIRDTLNKQEGEITSEDMASIKQLATVAANGKIYLLDDITGIKYCVNLESLELNFPLANIMRGSHELRGLANLKKLSVIDYDHNNKTEKTMFATLMKRIETGFYDYFRLPQIQERSWVSAQDGTMLFCDFKENLKQSALAGDENALKLYVNLNTAETICDQYSTYRKYSQIFGLCLFLGATDIYDIGCYTECQACMIAGSQGIYYTGIDCDKGKNGIDFNWQNKMFASYGEKIRFICAEYPFEIKAKNNNIAIAVGCVFEYEDSQVENAAFALARDFERIYVDLSHKNHEIFKNALADFDIYTINQSDYGVVIFATKYPEEITLLEEAGYKCGSGDDRLSLENIDPTRYIARLKEIAIRN